MARIAIHDLQAKEKDLAAEEMNHVVGGKIYHQYWTEYKFHHKLLYRGKKRSWYRMIRYSRRNLSAKGTNYGNWKRG